MDTDIRLVRSQLTVAMKLLHHRLVKLDSTRPRLSLHHARLSHTKTLISLLEELMGLVEQDPDLWDDNPDIVPF